MFYIVVISSRSRRDRVSSACRRSHDVGKTREQRVGHFSKYLRELIAKQVDDRRPIVWFDPERDFSDFAAARRRGATAPCRLRTARRGRDG